MAQQYLSDTNFVEQQQTNNSTNNNEAGMEHIPSPPIPPSIQLGDYNTTNQDSSNNSGNTYNPWQPMQPRGGNIFATNPDTTNQMNIAVNPQMQTLQPNIIIPIQQNQHFVSPQSLNPQALNPQALNPQADVNHTPANNMQIEPSNNESSQSYTNTNNIISMMNAPSVLPSNSPSVNPYSHDLTPPLPPTAVSAAEPVNTEEAETKETKEPKKVVEATFETALQAILDDKTRGISKADLVPELINLMVNEKNTSNRSLLLTIITCTGKSAILERFIKEEGLTTLNTWLFQAIKNKSSLQFIRLILKTLQNLPITLQALQTCSIGKTVYKLKSHSDTQVKKRAVALVAKWSQILNTTDKSKPKKRPREKGQTNTTAQATKKPKVQASKPTITSTNAFGSAVAAVPAVKKRKSLLTDRRKRLRKTQLLEDDAPLIPSKVTAKFVSRPMSVDDIRKAKKAAKLKSELEKEIADKLTGDSENVAKLGKNGKKKKTVTWAKHLVKVRTFKVDRLRHKNRNFHQAATNEHATERRLIELRKREDMWLDKVDLMEPTIDWYKPEPLDLLPGCQVGNGEDSKEKLIQAERVVKTLATYYPEAQIPNTPTSPPHQQSYDDGTITNIPLEVEQDAQTSKPSMLLQPQVQPQVGMPTMNILPQQSAPTPSGGIVLDNKLIETLVNANIDQQLLQNLIKNPTQEAIAQIIAHLQYKQQTANFQQPQAAAFNTQLGNMSQLQQQQQQFAPNQYQQMQGFNVQPQQGHLPPRRNR